MKNFIDTIRTLHECLFDLLIRVESNLKRIDAEDNRLELLLSKESLIEILYCDRKFRRLSKPSVCYNNSLMEKSIRWKPPNENVEDSHPSLKRRSFWRHSAVKVHKQNCVGGSHNLSEDQLLKLKHQLLENAASLFETTNKASQEMAARIMHLD